MIKYHTQMFALVLVSLLSSACVSPEMVAHHKKQQQQLDAKKKEEKQEQAALL